MALDSGALPTALTNTVARTDFNAAMAQLDAAFPLAKEDLGGDAVVTIKIKDLNVTPAKAALGFGRYVKLVPNAWDKVLVNFTTDGNAHVNGLDLSGIVPAGATGVVLRLQVNDDAAGNWVKIYTNAGAAETALLINTQAANIVLEGHATLPIDSDRLLDYQATNTVFTTINLAVIGYFT